MANEAYVVERVAEATKHPKSLLLGAIGAICSTPTMAANVAEGLGLSKEEIQGARWIALYNRGKTIDEFLNGILQLIIEKGDPKMKIECGKSHFSSLECNESEALWSKIIKRVFDSTRVVIPDIVLQRYITPSGISFDFLGSSDGKPMRKTFLGVGWGNTYHHTVLDIKPVSENKADPHFFDIKQNTWLPIAVRVYKAEFLPLAKELAKYYESETARRKKPAQATLIKEY